MPQDPQDEFAQYKRSPNVSGDDFSGFKRASTPQARSTANGQSVDASAQLYGNPLSVHDNLIRGFGTLGTTLMGIPGGIYHTFADAPSAEEKQQFGLSDNPDLVQKAALGAGRMFYKPVTTAVSDYGHGRVSPDAALSVMPEALGSAGGNVVAGKLMDTAGEGVAKGVGEVKPYIKPVGEAVIKGNIKRIATPDAYNAFTKVRDSQTPTITPQPGQFSSINPIMPKMPSPAPAPMPAPEGAIPGVNVRPSVERLSNFNSAPVGASEPPAPARTGTGAIPGVDVRPSIERIAEAPAPASAKAVEPPPLAPKRAAEVSAPSDVKPVVPSDEAVARMDRARNYRLGAHAGNAEADAYLTKTNQQLVDEANARKIDGRTDWNVKDLKRTGSVHGKFLAPAKEDLIGKLLQPDRTGADTSADISRAMSSDKSLGDIGKHEANMRQRAAESQVAREKLGPLGLESQKPTMTPPPAKGAKTPRYYDRYGKQ